MRDDTHEHSRWLGFIIEGNVGKCLAGGRKDYRGE
jgi:hypothetical protein